MSTIQKILTGVVAVAILGVSAYLLLNKFGDSQPQNPLDNPEKIVSAYESLLIEAEQAKTANADCGDKKGLAKQIKSLEDGLADLAERKKDWLDNVPQLPEGGPTSVTPEGRPGSEVPELTSDVPPLPELGPDVIVVPGSKVPELTSDAPSLPDINIQVVDDLGRPVEYVPELPELNTGRPGSEVPTLDSNVPPLPEINIADSNEPIIKMAELEQKIKNLLQELKTLCPEEENKKVISDKCSDACQRHKDCAAYTEDVTAADLTDAYNTCMEECPTWPKEMIKCINAVDIKTPNDCVSFVQCQVPQLYEERYLE
ncbi:MAG TPA: hypothetical protein PLN98_01910 [Candidatus Paceibacterota bacterium]|jgi:hypothetical protein|nr:hypothetical protein [Candidatus Paceibacterota bacterium]HQB27118.1 hypothetical protein [Candidatus Paceibacterota bacterium]